MISKVLPVLHAVCFILFGISGTLYALGGLWSAAILSWVSACCWAGCFIFDIFNNNRIQRMKRDFAEWH